MKIKFFVPLVCVSLLLSCKRENLQENELEGGIPLEITSVMKFNQNTDSSGFVNSSMIDESEDVCFLSGHGYAVGIGKSWDIATCKSNCTRGLGFRCGSDVYVNCSDGATIYVSHSNGGCPVTEFSPTGIDYMQNQANLINSDSRKTSAMYTLYSNGKMQIHFGTELPISEKHNDIFEVEEDTWQAIPDFIRISGKKYNSLIVKKGAYKVSRDYGKYGSVVVKYEFR